MEAAQANNSWVNTIDSKHPEAIAKAHRIIESNRYCTLSTCSPEGEPWVSPVFFVYDQSWNIYWSSAIESQHSQNLDKNQGRVAIAIFDSHPGVGAVEGLYLQGTAVEVESLLQVEEIIKLVDARTTNSVKRLPEDYLPDSHRRFYHFRPQHIWVTGERIAVGTQLVDTKIKLDREQLRFYRS